MDASYGCSYSFLRHIIWDYNNILKMSEFVMMVVTIYVTSNGQCERYMYASFNLSKFI